MMCGQGEGINVDEIDSGSVGVAADDVLSWVDYLEDSASYEDRHEEKAPEKVSIGRARRHSI
ncbi:hypothetical protein [Modicisalibacter xianhensis]|uniref:hypothetical protein n=1 Tax=Modicisalibacter xianhensis TaxID=442341 RepID=UPI001062E69C|nr:hypothetical protein [Halomonas xianhensis]